MTPKVVGVCPGAVVVGSVWYTAERLFLVDVCVAGMACGHICVGIAVDSAAVHAQFAGSSCLPSPLVHRQCPDIHRAVRG